MDKITLQNAIVLFLESVQEDITAIKEPKRVGTPISKLGIKYKGGVENIKKVYNEANQAEKEYWGKWYHNAKEDVKNLAQTHGLPFEVMAAIVATLSPGNKWLGNLQAANKLLTGDKKLNAYPRQAEKARKILKTGDVSLVSGPKVSVFFQSLLAPQLVEKQMVLDSHAINIWRGEKLNIKGVKSPSVEERKQMIADYERAADELGVSVQAVQAVTWYVWKYTDNDVLDSASVIAKQPVIKRAIDEERALSTGIMSSNLEK